MNSIDNIKDTELFEKLQKYNCTVTYNGKKLYEGIYNPEFEFDKKVNKSCVVVEFNVHDNSALFTLEHNTAIDEFKALMEGNTFDIIKSDARFYNKAMNIANALPVYNLEISESDASEYAINKFGANYRKIVETYLLMMNEAEEDKEKTTERGDIKFTIWESPDKKISWLKPNAKYQKIEYVYENDEKTIEIDFLLGQDTEGIWKLWCGKVGATSYDDDPYCTFETKDFAEGIVACLDKVQEMIADVKENPDNWVQFYVKA